MAVRPLETAISQHTRDVVTHYTARHAFRQDLFGQQPFANYGYWPHDELSFEQAGAQLTDLVAHTAGIADGDRILDVGCGYGANAVCYVRQCTPARVTGIDITEVRISNGRDYIAAQKLEHLIQLQLGDATRMEFADASFERLLAVECAFHFDTRRDFLHEAARVLVPGGTLALTDIIPRRGADPGAYMNGYRASASGVCLDIHANAYDADVYTEHLRAAGFTDIRIDSILEATRLPFARALRRLATSSAVERAQVLLRVAERIDHCSAGGEDYVLVFARKA
ncbi:MAG: class SAM-dependent methyltransferase [Nevskia sp.]|nr:class SAM-dependent methyltransferase [Nevskia sp.]